MPRPVQQARVAFLETVGEDVILGWIADGLYLSDIVERLDPAGKIGLSKAHLSLWLNGKWKRNTPMPDPENPGKMLPPETKEDAARRAAKHKSVRETWAEIQVDHSTRVLMNEESGALANLRRAQAEFALKIAGIFNARYKAEAKNQLNVAVQVNAGELHLDALRLKKLEGGQLLPVSQEVKALPSGEREIDISDVLMDPEESTETVSVNNASVEQEPDKS